MTDGEYLLNKGNNCPFCDSEDIYWEDISMEDSDCFQEVGCHTCKHRWFDKYTRSGYITKEY